MSIIIDKESFIDTYRDMVQAGRDMDTTVNHFKAQIKEMQTSLHIPIDLFFRHCKDTASDVTIKCKQSQWKWQHFTSVPNTELFGIHKKPNESVTIHHEDEWEVIWLRDVHDNVGDISMGEVTDDYVEVITTWNESGVINKPRLSIRIPVGVLVGFGDDYREFYAVIEQLEMEMDEFAIIGATVESAELNQLELLIAKHPEFAKTVFSKIKDCK